MLSNVWWCMTYHSPTSLYLNLQWYQISIWLAGGFNCLQLYPSLFRRGRGHNSTLYVKTASLAAVHSRCFRGHGYWEESDRQGMDKDATIGMGRNGGIFEDARAWHIAMWEFSVVCLNKKCASPWTPVIDIPCYVWKMGFNHVFGIALLFTPGGFAKPTCGENDAMLATILRESL